MRLESVHEQFLVNLEILRTDLLSRKYSSNSIQLSFDKVLSLNRKKCIEKVSQKENSRIPLVLPFHKALPKVSNILLKHWKILCDKYPEAKNFLPDPPMVCYTRDKNLRDILVRATLPPPVRRQGCRAAKQGFVRCLKRGDCTLCSHSRNSNSRTVYLQDNTTRELSIPGHITCTDENIIYVISCEKSNGDCIKVHPQYVGETGNSAKRRCAGHISSIVNSSQEDTTLPVGVHFRLPGHSHADMNFTPSEKIVSKDPFVRKVRESFFIKQYESLKGKDIKSIEHGLNLKP